MERIFASLLLDIDIDITFADALMKLFVKTHFGYRTSSNMRAARIRFGWAEIGPSIQFELGIPRWGV